MGYEGVPYAQKLLSRYSVRNNSLGCSLCSTPSQNIKNNVANMLSIRLLRRENSLRKNALTLDESVIFKITDVKLKFGITIAKILITLLNISIYCIYVKQW